jgi:Ca2+:H+ antiporter
MVERCNQLGVREARLAKSNIHNPVWSIIIPLAGVAAFLVYLFGYAPVASPFVAMTFATLTGGAVFASVHHAEVIAAKVGEPLGSIVLAVAVTIIEVGLILVLMLAAPDGGPTIARDTVYSAIMIIITGMIGMCLLAGGQRHFEQLIRVRGSVSALAVLSTLAVLTLILPNYTVATSGPTYSLPQLITAAALSLALYGIFLFVQTVRHRDYFLLSNEKPNGDGWKPPSDSVTAASGVLLCMSLFTVVALAKILSAPLNSGIIAAGLPTTFTGVVIAGLVLLPESIAAARAALLDRLQISINLALGSGLASIGLTIPAVALVSIVGGYDIQLGISASQTVLLALALFISGLTLSSGRTNILLGAVHLGVFIMFLLLSAVP